MKKLPQLLTILEWVVTVLLLSLGGLLLKIYHQGHDLEAIFYAIALLGLAWLSCPKMWPAKVLPSWQRIGLVIVISSFL